MRYFYTHEKAEQLFKDYFSEDLEMLSPRQYRHAFKDWLEHERITLTAPQWDNKMHNYKGYTILLDIHPVNAAIAASAIPDTGDTIRCVYYGHTKAQALRLINQAIDNELGA